MITSAHPTPNASPNASWPSWRAPGTESPSNSFPRAAGPNDSEYASKATGSTDPISGHRRRSSLTTQWPFPPRPLADTDVDVGASRKSRVYSWCSFASTPGPAGCPTSDVRRVLSRCQAPDRSGMDRLPREAGMSRLGSASGCCGEEPGMGVEIHKSRGRHRSAGVGSTSRSDRRAASAR